MKKQLMVKGNLFLSKAFFDEKGIPENSTKVLFKRKKSLLLLVDEVKYINYEDIPTPTKSKLPSRIDLVGEYHSQQQDSKVNEFIKPLQHALEKAWMQYRAYYKEKYPRLDNVKIARAAKAHAIWTVVLEIGGKDLNEIFKAYNELMPDRHRTYQSFSNARGKARVKGVEALAIDQKWFTAYNNLKRISPVVKGFVLETYRDARKFSTTEIHKIVCNLCKEMNEAEPSLSAVKKECDLLSKGVSMTNKDRVGGSYLKNKAFQYGSMHHASKPHYQWQVDGKTLAFWVGGNFQRWNLVTIIDACTKKILGSAIGKTENTIVIMNAYKDAITNVRCLPAEILTDNHSWNKTREAINFITEINQFGVTYTVTHSPTHKAITERYNQYLDQICRHKYGFIGEGALSKNKNAHPKKELLTELAKPKNQLSEADILRIGKEIVEEYNNIVFAKEGKSPNEQYNESHNEHSILLNEFDRANLLFAKTEFKIIRGQINIKRGMDLYEFQVSAEIFHKYNGFSVNVCYEDLNECIYLFDKKTNRPIGTVTPKPMIHGAKKDQTSEDLKQMQALLALQKKSQELADEETNSVIEKAVEICPDFHVILDKVLHKKEYIQVTQQQSDTIKYAKGGKPKSEPEPDEPTRARHPLDAPADHEIGIIKTVKKK